MGNCYIHVAPYLKHALQKHSPGQAEYEIISKEIGEIGVRVKLRNLTPRRVCRSQTAVNPTCAYDANGASVACLHHKGTRGLRPS